jgi:integrin beta 3
MVKDAVGLVPVPKDGKDGKDGRDAPTLDDLRAVIDGEVERRMALIQVKDGRDGRDAPALEDFRDMLKAMVADAAKDIPPGRDGRDAVGKDGKDGADGLGFDDMEMEEKDDRTIAFVFRRGDREKRFEYTFPTLVDRGTYKSGAVYERGDTITYGGSLFIAQRDTLPTEKPEDGSGAFRLAVKRGRDGS